MKIRNLQSLFVCPIILWRIFPLRMTEFFGWRSKLTSQILILFLPITLFHCWWMKRLLDWWTPFIQFLKIRCWWWRIWIWKKVSRYTMCVPHAWRPFSAARRYERMSQHPFRYSMRWEWHWSTGNVRISTANWFSILKIWNRTYNLMHFSIPVFGIKIPI